MTNLCFVFDWDSFWINIIAGAIFFVISLLFSIWLIPKFTIRLIKKKNKKFFIGKLSSLIQELCEFLMASPFKNNELNKEHLSIFTKRSNNKNYRFVGLSIINIFNRPLIYQIEIVILEFFKNTEPNQAYVLLNKEYERLKNFRIEIERILSNHSLHISEEIILEFSDLCLDIRTQELAYKNNFVYDELLKETNETRKGVFGYNELTEIYKKIFLLLKKLVSLSYFEYSIDIEN